MKMDQLPVSISGADVFVMPLGMLGANCYVLRQGDKAVAIDIGGDTELLLEALQGVQLEAILLTHGHIDHVGGVEAVRSAKGAAVYIHEKDAVMLQSAEANLAWHFSDEPFEHVQAYTTVQEGDTITAGGFSFAVLHTPGHTSGSVCYRSGEVLFTGDTLFRCGIGRTDLGGSNKDMLASLRRLAGMEENLWVCPGHGCYSRLDTERRSNPYLRGI